jgi:hypothetical protein
MQCLYVNLCRKQSLIDYQKTSRPPNRIGFGLNIIVCSTELVVGRPGTSIFLLNLLLLLDRFLECLVFVPEQGARLIDGPLLLERLHKLAQKRLILAKSVLEIINLYLLATTVVRYAGSFEGDPLDEVGEDFVHHLYRLRQRLLDVAVGKEKTLDCFFTPGVSKIGRVYLEQMQRLTVRFAEAHLANVLGGSFADLHL